MTKRTTTVTSAYVARCQPYTVEMACGHRFSRMMREETAGIPWTPEALIKTESPCQECFTASNIAERIAREGGR